MIGLYGVALEQLNNRQEELLSSLPHSVLNAWQKRHATLRDPLASLAGVWLLWKSGIGGTLDYTDSGKPVLIAEDGRTLGVSITHTATHAFCAVTDESDAIGVDAEDLGRLAPDRLPKMAARWFSDAERSAFEQTPTEETFLKLWTRKEALVKRSGIGLSALAKADTLTPSPTLPHFLSFALPTTILTLALPQKCEDSPVSLQMLLRE